MITDTQGFNDSEGRDYEYQQQMIAHIKQHGEVHAFILVFNGQNARWNKGTLEILEILKYAFPNFWQNLIVVLNFMQQSLVNVQMREQVLSDLDRERQVRRALQDCYNTQVDLKIYLIDTNFNKT